MQVNPPAALPEAPRIARWKLLTEHMLPALARAHHWPIRLDHCFKRITLDHAFSGVWNDHLKRPAERHLTGEPLARALEAAESLQREGLPLLRRWNAESLQYRGKLKP